MNDKIEKFKAVIQNRLQQIDKYIKLIDKLEEIYERYEGEVK